MKETPDRPRCLSHDLIIFAIFRQTYGDIARNQERFPPDWIYRDPRKRAADQLTAY
jgi:hypothetical protein